MAYRVLQRDPRDLSNRKAIGVQMPFESDTVFVPTYNSLEAYKVNLYNFFMTGKRERFLNPEMGSTLLEYLFEPIPDQYTVKAIQDNIQFEIEKFFPRLEVLEIKLEDFPEYNSVQVTIFFRIKNTELEDKLVIDVNR